MGVNFSPIEIGRRALRASQMGLVVAGQNIANVNTPGYTRQQVQLSSVGTDLANMQMTGAGVTIDGVRQFRDRFVESRLQRETAIAGRLTAQRDALAPVEIVFDEAEGGGIGGAMNSFFGAFRDLEAHPTSVPLRAVVVEKGAALAASFRSTYTRLASARRDADANIRAEADAASALAAQVATLNARIRDDERRGASTSELRDQRGEAMRQLSELTGAYAVETEDHTLTVTLGDGRALVVGDKPRSLQSVTLPPDGLTTVMLEGTPAVFREGRLQGLIDGRDAVAGMIGDLNDIASALVERVNTIHSAGTDIDGNAGVDFFELGSGGSTSTALDFRVAEGLRDNPRLVVASLITQPADAATAAGAIANLLTDTSTMVGGRAISLSAAYSEIVTDAGAGVKSADDALQTQQVILAQAAAQRESISGVSLDEEAINLLQYQRAYEAAARFLQVTDEITQTILALGQ